MTQVVLVLLLGAFGMLGWRHLKGTHSFPVLLTLLGVASLGLGTVEARAAWRNHVYTQAARDLTGRGDVTVSCQRTFEIGFLTRDTDRLGAVPYPPDGSLPEHAYLRKDVCAELDAFTDQPGWGYTTSQVRAVAVLAHEAMHLANQRDEAVAECMAVQRLASLARALGADPDAARRAARAYFLTWYPGLPADYRSDECRRGGSLDEGLPDAPW